MPHQVSTVKKQMKQLDTRLHNKYLTDKLEKKLLVLKGLSFNEEGAKKDKTKAVKLRNICSAFLLLHSSPAIFRPVSYHHFSDLLPSPFHL